MPNDAKHTCYAVQKGRDHYRCSANGCNFDGNLRDAIEHAVKHQWTVSP